MALSISAVGKDKNALREFLDVPYRIYRDDPHYVFPLLDEMKHFHDRKKNPFYRHAEADQLSTIQQRRLDPQRAYQPDHVADRLLDRHRRLSRA